MPRPHGDGPAFILVVGESSDVIAHMRREHRAHSVYAMGTRPFNDRIQWIAVALRAMRTLDLFGSVLLGSASQRRIYSRLSCPAEPV
jgi:hypothetical protein